MRDVLIRFVVPLVVLALAIPMILQKVSRNYFYGFRTPRTLSSDRVWYRANRASGIAMACASIVWLIAALIVPLTVEPEVAHHRVLAIGLTALGVALAASFITLGRIPHD